VLAELIRIPSVGGTRAESDVVHHVAALLRAETRGSHWREDFPGRDDAGWSGHVSWMTADGRQHGEFSPAVPTDLKTEVPTP